MLVDFLRIASIFNGASRVIWFCLCVSLIGHISMELQFFSADVFLSSKYEILMAVCE